MSQQVSRHKIVWDDIEFGVWPTECMRAYAYHKKERCAGAQIGAYTPSGMAHYGTPGIRRFRTYVNGRRVCDTVVCTACRVTVGKSARRRLEELSTHVAEIEFGPLTKNIRTDYYRPLTEPFGEMAA